MIIFSFRPALKYGAMLEKSFQDSFYKEYRRYFSLLDRGFIPGCIVMAVEPPFGAEAPLSPIGGKNLNRRALLPAPIGGRWSRRDRKGAF